jgi:murein DD-endopeptidase MepM/ murein hydrolase activator NlpD
MQILITDSSFVRTRALTFRRWQLAMAGLLLTGVLMMVSGAVYHFIFLTAAREGWPLMSQLVKLIVRDEIAQRERFMRENLDAMAQRVGEMQAKVIKLEAIGERVSSMAGVRAEEIRPAQAPRSAVKNVALTKELPGRAQFSLTPDVGGLALPNSGAAKAELPPAQGGPFIPLASPSLNELNEAVARLDERAETGADVFTLIESRLLEVRLQALLVPSTSPVKVAMGSGFGFRSDPFSGRAALHSGVDFPVDTGTPIQAAAGGVVVSTEFHAAYGNLLEIDHGNGLSTRYAHTSRILVQAGDLVKRGQVVAESGNTGRSTGPHLHFEVLVEGVPQDPSRFLAGTLGGAIRSARR